MTDYLGALRVIVQSGVTILGDVMYCILIQAILFKNYYCCATLFIDQNDFSQTCVLTICHTLDLTHFLG